MPMPPALAAKRRSAGLDRAVAEHLRAGGGRRAGDVDDVLPADRHAVERRQRRAGPVAPLGRLGLLPRPLGRDGDEDVVALALLDPVEKALDDLDRPGLAGPVGERDARAGPVCDSLDVCHRPLLLAVGTCPTPSRPHDRRFAPASSRRDRYAPRARRLPRASVLDHLDVRRPCAVAAPFRACLQPCILRRRFPGRPSPAQASVRCIEIGVARRAGIDLGERVDVVRLPARHRASPATTGSPA